jgi:hypothetical protein
MKNYSRTFGKSGKTSYRTPSPFRSNVWRNKIDNRQPKNVFKGNKGR